MQLHHTGEKSFRGPWGASGVRRGGGARFHGGRGSGRGAARRRGGSCVRGGGLDEQRPGRSLAWAAGGEEGRCSRTGRAMRCVPFRRPGRWRLRTWAPPPTASTGGRNLGRGIWRREVSLLARPASRHPNMTGRAWSARRSWHGDLQTARSYRVDGAYQQRGRIRRVSGGPESTEAHDVRPAWLVPRAWSGTERVEGLWREGYVMARSK
ncbi:hypothetical protein EJ04DRAFT_103235 [Polyplosphaeria fusca]|uniref:Uncharacterized protein n=1 Tax=Polyplosphaeria fusca TaxID=682080 RepID=A0A9P4R5W7_9PLEO|nr:hypothetical protein EJ04DRAFT_103235 [Polyplosphaeria fusca]